MNSNEFDKIVDEVIKQTRNTLSIKADEYATEDRLYNFKAAAELQRCTPVTALAGMMAKHTISVYDLIHRYENGADIETSMWKEKIGDSINYLILLAALLKEDGDSRTGQHPFG